jgi:hypothetical protein
MADFLFAMVFSLQPDERRIRTNPKMQYFCSFLLTRPHYHPLFLREYCLMQKPDCPIQGNPAIF